MADHITAFREVEKDLRVTETDLDNAAMAFSEAEDSRIEIEVAFDNAVANFLHEANIFEAGLDETLFGMEVDAIPFCLTA